MKTNIVLLLLLLFSSRNWSQNAVPFYPSIDASGIYFGADIDIDGNEVLVSSGSGIMSIAGVGKVYLFNMNNSNSIEQKQTLYPNDILNTDGFGQSITIQNNYIAVGAPGQDVGATDTGAVYMYQKVGTTYQQLQKIIAPDAIGLDYFGTTVKLNNNYLFIGATGEEPVGQDPGISAGAVYVYILNGTSWSFSEKITYPNTNNFGNKIEVENDILVISSSNSTDSSGSFSLHTYHREGLNWNFLNAVGVGHLEENPYDFCLDNNQIFVISNDFSFGQIVSILNYSEDNWNPNSFFWNITDILPVQTIGDQLYNKIKVNANNMFISSNQYVLQMERNFPVLYYRKNNTTWEYDTTLFGTGPSGHDDYFGNAIACKDNHVIIGAPYEGFLSAGKAYYLDTTLSNLNFEKKSTDVYPNPTHDVVHIETDDSSSVIIGVEVYTVTGNLIHYMNQNTKEISLENVDQGIYFMKVKFQNNTEKTFKIIRN